MEWLLAALLFQRVNADIPLRHYDMALKPSGIILNVPAVVEEEEAANIEPEQNPSKIICETIYEYGCSCMIGLQDLGYPIKGNDAKDLQSNVPKDYEPVRGDIILFKYPKNYHAAAVLLSFPSGNMQIYECNFKPGKCGTRIVFKDDKAIRGYIHNDTFAKILDKNEL